MKLQIDLDTERDAPLSKRIADVIADRPGRLPMLIKGVVLDYSGKHLSLAQATEMTNRLVELLT